MAAQLPHGPDPCPPSRPRRCPYPPWFQPPGPALPPCPARPPRSLPPPVSPASGSPPEGAFVPPPVTVRSGRGPRRAPRYRGCAPRRSGFAPKASAKGPTRRRLARPARRAGPPRPTVSAVAPEDRPSEVPGAWARHCRVRADLPTEPGGQGREPVTYASEILGQLGSARVALFGVLGE